jgi:hypothetical protein
MPNGPFEDIYENDTNHIPVNFDLHLKILTQFKPSHLDSMQRYNEYGDLARSRIVSRTEGDERLISQCK